MTSIAEPIDEPRIFHYDQPGYSRSDEKRFRELVHGVQIHVRDCSVIQKQIQHTLSKVLETASLLSSENFTIECYGTFLNNIAFVSDDLRLLLVHDTSTPEIEITALLKTISGFSTTDGTHQFCVNNALFAGNNTIRWLWTKWRDRGGPDRILVSLEVNFLAT